MTDRFHRRALWLFGLAVPVALVVVLLAPVPFMRGLGTLALVCAALGAAINAGALRTVRRKAYWPVGDTIAAVASPPPAPAGRTARYRAPHASFPGTREAQHAPLFLPRRLTPRMTSHA